MYLHVVFQVSHEVITLLQNIVNWFININRDPSFHNNAYEAAI